MKFSLSTLPFIDKEINIELFKSLKENGIKSIELFAQKPHCDLLNKSHFELLSKLEEGIGIQINSIHLPIYFNRVSDVKERKKLSLCSNDNNIRSNSIREIIRHIEIAHQIGIPIAVLHTGLEDNSESEINLLIESLTFINEEAKKNDILIAIENHTTQFVSVELLIELIHKIDTEHLGICLDIGHSNIFSNYMSDLLESRRYLFSLHLHDNNGEEDEHLLPYEGMIDFDYIIGYLRTSKFAGIVTLELNGENITSEIEFFEFLKKVSFYLNNFENPRLTYNTMLEPT